MLPSQFRESMSASLGIAALGGVPVPSDSVFLLRIARQPPSKTVYQRLLKPFPSIMLEAGNDTSVDLFVEVSLVRADSEQELSADLLEGVRLVNISNGVFATFKKLKINHTSQMQGCQFKLRFSLKRFCGTTYQPLAASVMSEPIEVFSHTQYLTTAKGDAPEPPVISEILPPAGASGQATRCVVIGGNFIHTPYLRVRFGGTDVAPQFHESGTLICNTPPMAPGAVLVSVSNDGVSYCATTVTFCFV